MQYYCEWNCCKHPRFSKRSLTRFHSSIHKNLSWIFQGYTANKKKLNATCPQNVQPYFSSRLLLSFDAPKNYPITTTDITTIFMGPGCLLFDLRFFSVNKLSSLPAVILLVSIEPVPNAFHPIPNVGANLCRGSEKLCPCKLSVLVSRKSSQMALSNLIIYSSVRFVPRPRRQQRGRHEVRQEAPGLFPA